jgi:hypothetical protein
MQLLPAAASAATTHRMSQRYHTLEPPLQPCGGPVAAPPMATPAAHAPKILI